jgi:hypothetical protein
MSQYYTPFRIDESSTGTNSAKYQTISLTANTVSTSTTLSSRRILITTGAAPVFVAFGADPVTSVTTGFQVPASSQMIFNFKNGDKIAAVSGSNGAISIIDLD